MALSTVNPLTPTKSIEGAGDENVLQRHVRFFDRNKDGIIYPSETFKGLRAIGCSVFVSTVGCIFINIQLSRRTTGKFSLLFPIEVKNIQKGKHGSDSDTYDSEGRFVASKFEEIFSKHARTHPNALTSEELKEMLKANREPKDIQGWIAASAEWRLLFSVAKDENGLLHKDRMRALYDGSLFDQLEKEASSKKKKNDSQ